MTLDISLALRHISPHGEWTSTDGTYDGVLWHGPGSKPSLAEVESARESIAANARWNALRSERDLRLSDSDKHVLPDRWDTLTVEQKSAWSAYRQALRDLPENTTDPAAPVWPVAPMGA